MQTITTSAGYIHCHGIHLGDLFTLICHLHLLITLLYEDATRRLLFTFQQFEIDMTNEGMNPSNLQATT